MSKLPHAVPGEGIQPHLQQWSLHRGRCRFAGMATADLSLPASESVSVQIERESPDPRPERARERANPLLAESHQAGNLCLRPRTLIGEGAPGE